MRVQVNDAVATGPTSAFSETPVIGDGGVNAGVRTARGGILVQAGDFNPERIILDDLGAGGPIMPMVSVGASFPGATVGVMDYSFGNFKLMVTSLPAVVPTGLTREVAAAPTSDQLSIASFNVENLSPNDPQTKFDGLAQILVNNLRSPDIVGLEEIQDNDGVVGGTASAVVDADQTLNQLIAAISAAGGPDYDYRQINPVDDQEGGVPGGNIRVAFLFRPDRVSFVDRPGGDPVTPVSVVSGPSGTELSFSPGRVDPTNTAWSTPEGTRRSLAGEFVFGGRKVFVIANHWKSKGGDQPLFGHFQPPTLVTGVQRAEQAQSIHDFVQSVLATDANANAVVLGDLNDFEFSTPLATLTAGGILHDLIERRHPIRTGGPSRTPGIWTTTGRSKRPGRASRSRLAR